MAVGASAGGVEALKDFVQDLPERTGAAFVILQHLAPDHESQLTQILGRSAKLKVVNAEDGQTIERDHIYVLQPDKYLTIVDRGLFAAPPEDPRGQRLVIDHFMRSLAAAHASLAAGVVLSGTGRDGSLGLREIRAAGGLTMAQTPASALYDGMPSSAINMGVVDFVGDISEITEQLVAFTREAGRYEDDSPVSQQHLNTITALLRARAGFDFSSYKRGTIERRVMRRVGLLRFRTADDYIEHLRSTPAEMQQLAADLLINVTGFFRDPEVWETVRERTLAPLLDGATDGAPVRIWVPAASTGEEAYTLAILLDEECEKRGMKNCPWQIFATDLDSQAIAAARTGQYPRAIEQDLSPERLKAFFNAEARSYRVSKRIRERVVFAPHNLLADPPFSRLSMISCRNLLIYLTAKAQARLFELFHFALEDQGYLLLGTSETASQRRRLFETVDAKAHLYRRVPGSGRRQIVSFDSDSKEQVTPRLGHEDLAGSIGDSGRTMNVGDLTRRSLLRRYAPPAATITADGEVLYFSGTVRDYLLVPEGEPTHNLFELVPPGARMRLREAVRAAANDDEVPLVESARHPASMKPFRVEVAKITSTNEPVLFICAFAEIEAQETAIGERPEIGENEEADTETYVRQLEHELAILREDLQTTVEELETSNEELKASNEEAMAANEELQSTNEELETSREELQSLNEELVTVNSQLEEKIREVQHTTTDLQNLLTSTELAVLFLAPDHTIRNFTRAAESVVDVREGDIGRPLSELRMKVGDPELLSDAKKVRSSLQPVERVIEAENDRWYLRRIHPYRGTEDRIEGVVITYADVTSLYRTRLALEQRERQQAAIAQIGEAALVARSIDGLVKAVLPPLRKSLAADTVKLLQLSEDKRTFHLLAGEGWHEGVVGSGQVENSKATQAGYTLRHGAIATQDVQTETRFSGPQLLLDHDIHAGISAPIVVDGEDWGVLGIHAKTSNVYSDDDIAVVQSAANIIAYAISQMERERRTLQEKLTRDLAFRAAELAFWRNEPETDESVWGEELSHLLGHKPGELPQSGSAFFECIHPEDVDEVKDAFQRTIEDGEPFEIEFRVVWPNGDVRWLAGRGARIPDSDPVIVMGVNYDVTQRRQEEERQALIMRELDHRVKNMLAVILSIAQISGRGAVDTKSFVSSFTDRVKSMSQAHSLISEGRWSGVSFYDLLHQELAPYEPTGSENVGLSGPPLSLKPEAAQALSMAIHEMATNAAKYGALSVPDGRIDVSWRFVGEEGAVQVDWAERGGPAVAKPERKGFGSTVIEKITGQQLGNGIELDFAKDGLRASFQIAPDHLLGFTPPKSGEKTDKPDDDGHDEPAGVEGKRILVLDDEWLIATQNERILGSAGAEVVGPAANLPDARKLAETSLDAALLDLNIAGESAAGLAHELMERGVPVVFLTGYSERGPEAPEGATLLTKPIPDADLLAALSRAVEQKEGQQ